MWQDFNGGLIMQVNMWQDFIGGVQSGAEKVRQKIWTQPHDTNMHS